jgi:hypothetical protein
MNWKLILRLSLFGLVMAFATISWIPQQVEYFCWPVIFIICAVIIARRCTGKYFLHGFVLSLVNCIWITGAHTIFHDNYLANHPDMAQMSANWPLAHHPRIQMLVSGAFFGIGFGLVLGLFAFIASRIVKRPVAAS